MLGPQGVQATLAASGISPAEGCASPAAALSGRCFPALQTALAAQYGAAGSVGILLRTGASYFNALLRIRGDQIGLLNLEHRLQPAAQRIRNGLEMLAAALSTEWGTSIQVSEEEQAWVWEDQACPWCRQLHADEPLCYLTAGMLREYLAWTSGGKFYPVLESECRAMGSKTCRYRIEKQPLG